MFIVDVCDCNIEMAMVNSFYFSTNGLFDFLGSINNKTELLKTISFD